MQTIVGAKQPDDAGQRVGKTGATEGYTGEEPAMLQTLGSDMATQQPEIMIPIRGHCTGRRAQETTHGYTRGIRI